MFEQKQSVIIVKGDGKEKEYAQMLAQILGRYPNIILPQPITETEYKENSELVNSNQKIIFFGNGKETELQSKAVNWQYDRFGMRYGWMGNRCVVTADVDRISLEDQSAFADYYNGKIKEFRLFIKECLGLELSEVKYSELNYEDMNEFYDEVRWSDTDEVEDKVAKAVAAVVGSPLMLLGKGLVLLNNAIENVSAKSERKNLWRHQYELLVVEFILNGLSRFMDNFVQKEIKGKVMIVYDVKDADYAHLLHNLIQQYNGYNVIEYTEEMFIDNAKKNSSKQKIIFLGNTESSKERWLDIYKYMYDENGMRYGWFGNHAFVNVSRLKKECERNAFLEEYAQKRRTYENTAKTYVKDNHMDVKKKIAGGIGGIVGGVAGLFGLPIITVGVGCYAIQTRVDHVIDTVNAATDLIEYQYQLLLREFVFNGFEKFMEG